LGGGRERGRTEGGSVAYLKVSPHVSGQHAMWLEGVGKLSEWFWKVDDIKYPVLYLRR
jgi:hypothetical protein